MAKISSSMLSTVSENTAALASMKFDFAVVKVEAPAEYSGLGEALSIRRHHEAEDGIHHKTARRLATLFEERVPSTPKLITAYGLRSSEILKTPGINPKGSPSTDLLNLSLEPTALQCGRQLHQVFQLSGCIFWQPYWQECGKPKKQSPYGLKS